jgi:hypothetical protein
MASLPASTSRKFNPSDYKGAPQWFLGRFLSALNLFTEPVYLALLNGLTFTENFDAQYFTQLIIAGATPQSNAFSFNCNTKNIPREVIKAQCSFASDLTIPITAAVDFGWYFSSGVIFIPTVFGLVAGSTYRLTLRVS